MTKFKIFFLVFLLSMLSQQAKVWAMFSSSSFGGGYSGGSSSYGSSYGNNGGAYGGFINQGFGQGRPYGGYDDGGRGEGNYHCGNDPRYQPRESVNPLSKMQKFSDFGGFDEDEGWCGTGPKVKSPGKDNFEVMMTKFLANIDLSGSGCFPSMSFPHADDNSSSKTKEDTKKKLQEKIEKLLKDFVNEVKSDSSDELKFGTLFSIKKSAPELASKIRKIPSAKYQKFVGMILETYGASDLVHRWYEVNANIKELLSKITDGTASTLEEDYRLMPLIDGHSFVTLKDSDDILFKINEYQKVVYYQGEVRLAD